MNVRAPTGAADGTDERGERFGRPALLAGAALVAGWPVALSQLHRGDVYAVMGPYGLLVIAALSALAHVAHVPVLTPRHAARSAAMGLGVGVVMTVLTYVVYAGAVRRIPSLAVHVGGLYRASHAESTAVALAWTAVVVVAEELLWRGWLLVPLARRVGARGAMAISLVTYALAQAGSGSVVMLLAALVCGAIWLALRSTARSILAPLVAHAIWTFTIVHALPLTRVVAP